MDIRIGKPGKACSASNEAFAHGDPVVSLVRVEAQEDGKRLVREDYRSQAWSDELAHGALAVWQTEYVDPKALEGEPAEAQSPLRRLFYAVYESEERQDVALAYLGAQLLRRQKAFRLLKEFEDSEEDAQVALFTDNADGRLVEIRDPGLSFEELREAQGRLVERLAELETPAEPSADNSDEENHGEDA